MFRLVALTLLCAFAFINAAPQGSAPAEPIAIVSQSYSNDGSGTYQSSFESANGIKSTSDGELKDAKIPTVDAEGKTVGEEDGKVQVQHGEYSYQSPEGQTIVTKWSADENGFHATGDHLPVAPVDPAAAPVA